MLGFLGFVLVLAIFIRGIPLIVNIMGWMFIIFIAIIFPPLGLFLLFLLLLGLFSK